MLSTFAGIELGKRSLTAVTQGLHTIGHNMTNASAPGYSRQRVEMQTLPALYFPGLNREETNGQLGQGLNVERIERVRDMLLEGRIVAEANVQGYWAQRDKYLLMLEQVYNEPLDLSVRAMMDKFWESWQELSLHPADVSARMAVLQRGATLVDAIHQMHSRLKATRDMLEGDIAGTVGQVNTFSAEIAALNKEILRIKAQGDNPNDLLDRRDLLVSQLSSLIEVSVSERDPDEFTIYTGGMHIVQGGHFELLTTVSDPANEGYSKVVWQDTQSDASFRRGKLGALVELRDVDAKWEIQKLDLMTVNFVDMVNEIHRKGLGLTQRKGLDFFVEYPFINNVAGNYDRDGDGAYDASYIFRITGANALEPKDQIGLRGTLTLSGPSTGVLVDYYPTDTVEQVIKRINQSGSEVVARLDHAGNLTLKGVPSANTEHPDFVIRHVEDSGQLLVGYAGMLDGPGPDAAYDWETPDAVLGLRGGELGYAVAPLSHPAGWIDVNQLLFTEPGAVVASFEPGDGAAALAIARLRTEPVMLGITSSFDDYYAQAVAEVGLKGEQAAVALEAQELILKQLDDLRESISGVNMDEEITNMIKFQHAYSAAARFITEVDSMLDIIINRLGV